MKKFKTFIILLLVFSQAIFGQTKKGFNLANSSLPLNEIKDGGPPKDGIASIDKPKFIAASKATLNDKDRILGVFINGIAKAYPISILNYHEIVNDYFGENPVVITYCPLCGSGIAFNAVVNKEPKTFGVSGLLYNSDVLLYDRETQSLWSQLKYEAISGKLLGEQLEIIPTANTSWGDWREKYPNTLVLSSNTGFNRDYSINPYPGYDKSSAIYFEVSEVDSRFHPKETVIGIEVNAKTKAYPFSELQKLKKKILKDTFQGKVFTIKYNDKSKSAEVFDSKDKIVPAVTNFWFAWYAFHPQTKVYSFKN